MPNTDNNVDKEPKPVDKKTDNATLAKIAEDEDKKLRVRDDFKKKILKLDEVLNLDEKAQFKLIRETLEDIYDEAYIVAKKNVLKVVSLIISPDKEDEIFLPNRLRVKKKDNDLIFYVKKEGLLFLWYLLGLGLLIFATIAATYSAVLYNSRAHLNKDIDGDKIPDINLDIDNDYIADINVDTNKDDKPNTNIDYKGNRKSVFNIDADKDGVPDYNLITYVKDDPAACTVNCDIDDDGWPDLNIDIDGDGTPDLDIDTDKNGKPDLNLDVDGDSICDVMCDTDGDGVCDKECITSNEEGKHSGSTMVTGDPNVDYETAYLQINFLTGNIIEVKDIFPDDQPDLEKYGIKDNKIPDKVLRVENLSKYALMYSLKFNVTKNTFTSQNFKYKITSTNGGGSFDWKVAPKTSTVIFDKIIIPARSTQTYTVSFKLEGVNGEQNYDQGKEFVGFFMLNPL